MSAAYGSIRLVDGGRQWEIDCEPHVKLRLKRWLPRIGKGHRGRIRVSATDDLSRDLEAFCYRFPLEQHPAGELERRARAYDARVSKRRQAIAGAYTPPPALEMAIPARDYQRQAAALCHVEGGLLLADELGLGKTVTALTLLALPGALPALVVCPTHLVSQWIREVERFLPTLCAHALRKGTPYPLGRDQPDLFERGHACPDVLVSSYHKLPGWADTLAHVIRTVVWDEAHELRREGSDKYNAAQFVAAKATFRLGLTGTPIFNYGGEIHNVLQCIRPGELGTWSEFATEWCTPDSWQKEKARLQEPRVFGHYLRSEGLMLRRTKAEVDRELPPLQRIVHEVDCDHAALKAIETDAIQLARIIVEASARFDRMKASQELSNAVRQATGIAKAPYVAAFVRMLVEAGDPVILCGWHRSVYDIWNEQLADLHPVMVTGSETPAAKDRAVQAFVRGESDVLVLSLRSGAGIDGLQRRCSRIVFGELDWTPSVHEQCVGRVFRDGQTAGVIAYFLVATDGCDPIMVDVLGLKTEQLEGIRDPDAPLVEAAQTDPDHIRRLAEAYLRRGGRQARPSTAVAAAMPVAGTEALPDGGRAAP